MGEERVPRREFIRLSAVAGLGVAGSSVLVACGGEQGEQGGQATTPAANGGQETTAVAGGETTQAAGPTTTSPTVEPGGIIVAEAFIPPGLAFAFNVAGDGGPPEPAVLVHMQDESWVAYSAVCTHKGCQVNYQLESGNLGCPCHGSMFDPTDAGAVVQGPAQNPLPEIEVRVEGGNVVLA